MNLDGWLKQRRGDWSRLETIVNQLYKNGPRGVPAGDLGQMLELYQAACADLARLRAQCSDPAIITPLNRLVSRAHGQIYRGAAGRSWGVVNFFLDGYPRLFRATWRFTLASFLLSALSALMAYSTVQHSPQTISDILGGRESEFAGYKERADIRERFGHGENPVLSSLVIVNNIRVALMAFAFGITFAVGTVYVLVVNGAMLGGIAGAFAKNGVGGTLWMVIMPHGALELSAIVAAGGAGLLLGYSLWAPGRRTRRRALREESVRAVQLAVGLVPAFIVAGIFEGFVTPTDAIPDGVKVVLGALAALLFWSYLLLAGRRKPAQ